MNGSKKSERVRTSEEYALVLKAAEIVEVVRCVHQDQAEDLVLDILRGVAADVAARPRAKALHISGTMHRAAGGLMSECQSCGEYRHMFRRPSGALWCGDCFMFEYVASTQAT